MKLNLNQPVLGLNGQASKENLSKIVADMIASTPKIEGLTPIRAYDIALKLYNDGEVELDATDSNSLKRFIENNDNLFIIAKGQVLKCFNQQ